jgi:hypothetical protein
MVDHVLFLRLDLAVLAKDEREQRLTDQLHSLSAIPGCVSVSFGRTFLTERAQGYTHVLSVRLVDEAALGVYQKHPMHVRVRDEELKPCVRKEPLLPEHPKAPLVCLDAKTVCVKGPASTKAMWQGLALGGWATALALMAVVAMKK